MAVAQLAGPNVDAPAPHDVSISRTRRVSNGLFWGLSTLMLLLLVTPVVWILSGVIAHALPKWHWSVLTEVTNGFTGGLSSNIVGTVLISGCVGILAGVIGISGGIYLTEMRNPGKVTSVLRSASEILAGIPSIVFGYCGYLVLCVGLKWGSSLLPAVIVLGMLVVPYIMKATEISLGNVPLAYRDAAEGLGMGRTYMLRKILLRAALPGIATGIIVAVAISVGETAPLLFTAGFTDAYPKVALIHHPVGYLTYAVFNYLDEPVKSLQLLAFQAAFLLVAIVLALILSARLAVRLSQKFSPERAAGGGGRAEIKAAKRNRALPLMGIAEGLADNRMR